MLATDYIALVEQQTLEVFNAPRLPSASAQASLIVVAHDVTDSLTSKIAVFGFDQDGYLVWHERYANALLVDDIAVLVSNRAYVTI
jgi:hypothetical protein